MSKSVAMDDCIYPFDSTDVEFESEQTVHGIFEQQVDLTPKATAIVDSAGNTITYEQLNIRANQVARYLLGKGTADNEIVAVIMDRTIEMMISLFGILKAGCAYLPLSTDIPTQRLQGILKEAKTSLLLSSVPFPKIDGFGLEVIVTSEDIYRESGENLAGKVESTDLCYVIYTSGSTGTPKGVMVEHRSLVNRLSWMQKNCPIGMGDTLLQKTSPMFDVSIWELFWWSFHGARLCLLGIGMEKFPLVIVDAVVKFRVTVLHFVPSMFYAFLGYMAQSELKAGFEESVKKIFVSGEALMIEHLKRFYDLFDDSIALVNLYGPTEATIDVSYYACSKDDLSAETIPIGKPIDNTRFYVLDEEFNPLAIGEKGGLYIGGVGVARGYLNRPDLTKERFFQLESLNSGIVYATGDIVSWREDGNLEFWGRKDNQVKIRGFRIELQEIEVVMNRHEQIEQCSVWVDVVRDQKVLVAAFVAKEALHIASLKDFLGRNLPDYMIPSRIFQFDCFPLTTSGKTDAQRLRTLANEGNFKELNS